MLFNSKEQILLSFSKTCFAPAKVFFNLHPNEKKNPTDNKMSHHILSVAGIRSVVQGEKKIWKLRTTFLRQPDSKCNSEARALLFLLLQVVCS